MTVIVGLTGLKQSGKTTAQNYLAEQYGLTPVNYADELKAAVSEVFNLDLASLHDAELKETVVQPWGKTPRHILQRFGTEVGRAIDEDVWVKLLFSNLTPNQRADGIVIGDVRFKNEVFAIRERGGIVIGVKRDTGQFHKRNWLDKLLRRRRLKDAHASELEMLKNWEYFCDEEIDNNQDLDYLHGRLDMIMTGVTNAIL